MDGLLELKYWARRLTPMSLCMALVMAMISAVDVKINLYQVFTAFYSEISPDTFTGVWSAVINSSILMGVIIVMKVLFVVLLEYRCYETFHSKVILCSLTSLFIYLREILQAYKIPIDYPTVTFIMWNFEIIGIICKYWKHPFLLQLAYKIFITAFGTFLFVKLLPDWNTWPFLAVYFVWAGNISVFMDPVNFTWAQKFPEVRMACTMNGLYALNNSVAFCYTPLKSYMQNGPQCGIVALAMYKRNPTRKSVKQLFRRAKKKGYTNAGEMFSVADMAALAKSELDSIDVQIFKGCLNCEEIKNVLLNDGCLLVPYDRSEALSPGLHNGKKAHWAVVCGCLQTEDDFYVFARHGTERRIEIWKLSELAESNAQLNEDSSKDFFENMIVPDGGIGGPLGLKSQSIVLKSSYSCRT